MYLFQFFFIAAPKARFPWFFLTHGHEYGLRPRCGTGGAEVPYPFSPALTGSLTISRSGARAPIIRTHHELYP
jgi:hypothetical protein